jgi:hypothetical protein
MLTKHVSTVIASKLTTIVITVVNIIITKTKEAREVRCTAKVIELFSIKMVLCIMNTPTRPKCKPVFQLGILRRLHDTVRNKCPKSGSLVRGNFITTTHRRTRSKALAHQEGGGGCGGLQPPLKRNLKNTDFAGTMISTFYVIYASA